MVQENSNIPVNIVTEDDSSLLSEASFAYNSINGAETAEKAKEGEARLLNIAHKAGNSSVAGLILSLLTSVKGKITQLEQEQYAANYARIDPARFIIDAQTQQLYDGMKDRGILNKDEVKYIESIDPKKIYKVQAFDEKGRPIKGETRIVTGAELRESAIVLKAHGNRHLLTQGEKEALNIKLFGEGKAHGPTEAADYSRAAKVIKGHIDNVQGDAYVLALTDTQRSTIVSSVIKSKTLTDTYFKELQSLPAAAKTDAKPTVIELAVENDINSTLDTVSKSIKRRTNEAPKPLIAPDTLKTPNEALIMGFKESLNKKTEQPASPHASPDMIKPAATPVAVKAPVPAPQAPAINTPPPVIPNPGNSQDVDMFENMVSATLGSVTQTMPSTTSLATNFVSDFKEATAKIEAQQKLAAKTLEQPAASIFTPAVATLASNALKDTKTTEDHKSTPPLVFAQGTDTYRGSSLTVAGPANRNAPGRV